MEVGMSLFVNGTSRERGLRGRGGHSGTGQGLLSSEIFPLQRNPCSGNDPMVVARSRSNLEILRARPPGCHLSSSAAPISAGAGAPRLPGQPSSVIFATTCLSSPPARHFCIQGLAFVVLKMAWELTRQRWIRTINSKYIYGLVVGFHPLLELFSVMWMAWMMQVDKQEPLHHVHHPAPMIHLAAASPTKD